MVVILGTAHLQTTPGKQSPDGRLKEFEYSRKIVQMIKKELESKGITTFIDYEPLTPNAQMKASTAKQEQSRELTWRVNYVNSLCKKYGTKNCIYVSVHVNAAGAGSQWLNARGWMVCISQNASTNSKRLARDLYKRAEEAGLKGNRWVPAEKYWVQNLYVCKSTNCPAVLTENLYQDNKEDVEFLLSDEGTKKIVDVHVNGIMDYINGK